MIGRYGSIGKVHYVKQDFWPLNTTLFVKDFKGNDIRFVGFLLETIDVQSFNDKTSVPGINRNDIHAIPIGVPELKEQLAIARTVEVVEQKLQAEMGRQRTLTTLFNSLLHNLMTGKVRVV